MSSNKRIVSHKYIVAAFVLLGSIMVQLIAPLPSSALLSGSDFNAARIIDDSIFYNKNALSAQGIQKFLESQVSNCTSSSPGCLKSYMVNETTRAADQYCSGSVQGGYKIAAQVIWDVSQACNINPQSLIVLLQKEQGLVSSSNPTVNMYTKATGFACPDTAACDTTYSGLDNQLFYAARQFQRYAKNPNSYSYVAGRNNNVLYKPNTSCGSTPVYIQTQATAGLYNYTPYQPNQAALNNLYGTGDSCSAYGNRNFWRLFTDWFGSTTDGRCYFGTSGGVSSDVVTRRINGQDRQAFIINSSTGSGCVEIHTWNPDANNWTDHIATNQPTIDATDLKLYFADLNGDKTDEAILVGLANTSSGYIEFHVWNASLKSWQNHYISNQPAIDTSKSTVQFGDTDGDGKDEAILIGQANGSTSTGNVEFHIWNSGFQTWRDHVVSNSQTLDPALSSIKFGDTDGDGKDEAILIGQANGSTSTGNVEFHIWNSGFQTWRDHVVSNSQTLDPALSSISFVNTNGGKRDSGLLAGKKGPTGSGYIEFHIWNPGLTSWSKHTVSNQPAP